MQRRSGLADAVAGRSGGVPRERARSAPTIARSRKRKGTPLKILVIGAAGMIGRKLMGRLASEAALGGEPIEGAHCVDVVSPAPLAAPFPIASEACDIAAAYVAPKLIAGLPDVIFLLASIVSGE